MVICKPWTHSVEFCTPNSLNARSCKSKMYLCFATSYERIPPSFLLFLVHVEGNTIIIRNGLLGYIIADRSCRHIGMR